MIPNYELLEQIGEGGFGLIYKARHINTNQIVAIKVLKATPISQLRNLDEQETVSLTRQQSHQKARFERETQLCAQINHPHIVKLLDKGYTTEGHPFATFEYIDGETLKERITQNNGLSTTETGVLMGQVLDALACAHAQGIVHRDLKPQNIMVTQTGATPHVKVLDFGIGAFTHEHRTADYQSLTLTKEMVGTPSYSAPEQLRGEPPTVKSDLYAWGLILLECLTGAPVMEGGSLAEIFAKQINTDMVPIPASVLSHPLAALLRRVLEKNPRVRAGDAAKFHEEYTQLNFSALVGKIVRQTPALSYAGDDDTIDNDMESVMGQSSKRQITVLCVKTSLILPKDCPLEIELLDPLQKEQLNSCNDVVTRYGGYIAGRLADTMSIYFGYPEVTGNDARRAGRTALELISQAQNRSLQLEAQYNISLNIKLSMHSGEVLIRPNQAPEGLTPNVAFNLLEQAPPNTVLVSETSKQLLNPYLEFKAKEIYSFGNVKKPVRTFSLVGERQTEAMSFLRPWSANRQMIGRDAEQRQVLDLWQKVRAGKGQATLIHGQAGIGKSKLVYESKRQLRRAGFMVRECRCLPEHTNNALYPFFAMLRKHWGLHENDDAVFNIVRLENELTAAHCDADVTLPILCSWLSIPLPEAYPPSQATPEKQKEILLATLEKLILNLAKAKKFLLVIEDLHWLDPTSQEFLETLLANLAQQPYLLLMTTRPVYIPNWKHNNLTTIELQPLTRLFVKNLVEGVLKGKNVDDKTVDYISKRADGVPLFIEELTHMLEEQNYLVLENNTYHLNEQQDIEKVPITLQDLLNARLDKLGPVKETARLAATIGRNFTYDVLIKTSLRNEALVQADLDQLMNADLVYRQRKVQSEGYIFRHSLIRNAAYDGMPKALQQEIHGRIAVTLENSFPEIATENPFEIGRHFAGAEKFVNASEYGIKAVKKQVSNSANMEAVATGNAVLAWIKEIVKKTGAKTPEQKGELKKQIELELMTLEVLSAALIATEGFGGKGVEEAIKQMKEQVDFLNTLDITLSDDKTDKITHRIQYTMFLHYQFNMKFEEAGKIAQKLLKNSRQSQNVEQEATTLSIITHVYIVEGDWAQAIQLCNRVLEIYETEVKEGVTYDLEPKSATFCHLAIIYYSIGYPNKALSYIEQAITCAEQMKHIPSIANALIYKAGLGYYMQDKNIAKNVVETYKKKYAKFNTGWMQAQLNVFDDWAKGEVKNAVRFIDEAMASGQNYGLPVYESSLAETYIARGEYDQAIQCMEASVKRCTEYKQYTMLPYIINLLALSYHAKDKKITQRVIEQFEKSIRMSQKYNLKWYEFKATVDYALILPKGKPHYILTQLKQIMSTLTEGHTTLSYKQAKKLLEKEMQSEA